ncbi:MAG: hypothetical protein M3044_23075, partial [Thermoproteota archaeon]|nr:hypothetical protein [Thermoproteota archaeon]
SNFRAVIFSFKSVVYLSVSQYDHSDGHFNIWPTVPQLLNKMDLTYLVSIKIAGIATLFMIVFFTDLDFSRTTKELRTQKQSHIAE